MEQCLHCAHRMFFKPLPDETFTCCFAWAENVRIIDIMTGVSPAIKKYGIEGKPCPKFKAGTSIFRTDEVCGNPFIIHPIRKEGEKFLYHLLGCDR